MAAALALSSAAVASSPVDAHDAMSPAARSTGSATGVVVGVVTGTVVVVVGATVVVVAGIVDVVVVGFGFLVPGVVFGALVAVELSSSGATPATTAHTTRTL